ncbi:hypothetical protein [Mesobacillus jeotgali]|uniref:hypothetical protein n=1 Tax=Mesobacillus jeotgali TaxID=129985 RepID=UPI00159191FB|nr:hypothetical protein [Mesobacillus jeotgali]
MDRFWTWVQEAVRSQGIFGQVWGLETRSCQKSWYLWTGLEFGNQKLSEVVVSLDRFEVGMQEAVRSKGIFGQVWRLEARSCQKSGYLWTGFGVGS